MSSTPTINDSKCVLVTGATAGIGRALATAIAKLPSKPQVVAAGRRQERLDELKEAEGIETVKMDIDTDFDTIRKYVDHLVKKYPEMDTLILNAGKQVSFDFKDGEVDLQKIQSEFNLNYLSVVATIAAFIPHLKKLAAQGRPCMVVPVTSSLAVVPGAHVPNYCATKAALHSFIVSMQIQFKDSGIQFLEILPPLTESELHDSQGTTDALSKFWLPLDQFVSEAMAGLKEGKSQITAGTSTDDYEKFGRAAVEEAKTRVYRKP